MAISVKRGRIALVTGASRGIGREIALRLGDVEDIARIAVHYHQNTKAAREVVRLIEAKGKAADLFRADLTRPAQARALVKAVLKDFGRIDILVNNFGPFLMKPWTELGQDEWERIINGNLLAAHALILSSLPGMRRRKAGRVVNIGYSRAEHLASFPNILPYAVAKTGLLMLTRTVAVSEANLGITVNMVSPGLMKGGRLPQTKSAQASVLGEFRDVAEAVVFLVSENAKAVTGANIPVAGTWKM